MIGYSERKPESENCIIQAVLCFSTVKSPFYIKLRPMNSVSQEICLMVWLRVWGPIIMRTETSCSEVSRRPLLTNQRLSCSSLTNQKPNICRRMESWRFQTREIALTRKIIETVSWVKCGWVQNLFFCNILKVKKILIYFFGSWIGFARLFVLNQIK